MTNSGGRPNAVVVGAGFTGLVTAYALQRKGYSVEVYERSEREGGILGTTEIESGIAESGANAFMNSARVEALFADLNIALIPTLPEARSRYIFRGRGPIRWPLSFLGTLRLILFVLRFIFKRASVTPRAGESLSLWGRRVMGEESTEYLLLPAFQGIYAGEGRRLSATLLMKTIFSARTGPKPKFRGSVSAPSGMGEVMKKLRERLESCGVRFHFRTEGPSSVTDLTYFCGSASESAESLAQIDPGLSRLLYRIEMVPLVSVTAFFRPDRRVKVGFGVLFPPKEGFRSLGVLYNHSIFPHRVKEAGILSETWIMGGARRPEITGLDSDQLLRDILEDRKRLNGFEGASEAPMHYVLHRWVRAIPYYTVELEEILEEISRRNLGSGKLRLMGNYLGGIGLTKILDRVMNEIEGTSQI